MTIMKIMTETHIQKHYDNDNNDNNVRNTYKTENNDRNAFAKRTL